MNGSITAMHLINTNNAHERQKRNEKLALVPSITSDYDFEVMTVLLLASVLLLVLV